jgi:hypothetical protein
LLPLLEGVIKRPLLLLKIFPLDFRHAVKQKRVRCLVVGLVGKESSSGDGMVNLLLGLLLLSILVGR